MSKLKLFIVTLITITAISCSKDEVIPEETQIENYVVANKLVVTEKTASGLRYIRTSVGVGSSAPVKAGQTVSIGYVGKLLNGTVFDPGNRPFTFRLGSNGAIQGFEEGVLKMKVGEKATLIFPSKLGYGSSKQDKIPANSPLTFDIQVLSAN